MRRGHVSLSGLSGNDEMRQILKLDWIRDEGDEAELHSHRCPLVSGWQRMGLEPEMIERLCKIAHQVDYGNVESFVQRNNEEESRNYGRRCAPTMGSNTMADLAREIASWGEGGVLEEAVLEHDERTYAFNVTGCLYVERYEALGVRKFGYCLSCCRDKPFVEGFNPKIKFKRTQTIMEGAPYCDFRYMLED